MAFRLRNLFFSLMVCSVGAIVLLPPAFAQIFGPMDQVIDAQSIIDHCWQISEDKRNGNNALMREGNLDTALCLEKAIIENASKIMDSNYHSPESLAKKFHDYRILVGRFYWDLYNENNGCLPSCGTMYYVFANWRLAKYYEDILKDVVSRRNKYKW